MILEFVAGILSGALVLIADAGHMAIDVAASFLGLFALWIAQRPPTEQKTYGYYRAEILAALVNGAALVAASIWIFLEAWNRIRTPEVIQSELMTIIATGGLIVNLIGLAIVHRGRKESLNLRGVWLHLLSDTLGSISAVLAGILCWNYGWYLADPIMSVGVAVLILHGSWKLLSEVVNVLLEGVPRGVQLANVRMEIERIQGVQEVHDLHIWTVTSGIHALSAHVKVKETASYSAVLSKVTEFLKQRYQIDHVTLQLEPLTYSHKELHF